MNKVAIYIELRLGDVIHIPSYGKCKVVELSMGSNAIKPTPIIVGLIPVGTTDRVEIIREPNAAVERELRRGEEQ